MRFIIEILSKPQKGLKLIVKLVLLVAICLVVGIYAGNAFFGERSFEALSDLKRLKLELYEEIQNLQSQNAALQKEYLEKRALDPELN